MFSIKRLLDIILSIVGIIVCIPVFPLIGLLIKLDSKGPVFYKVKRVGKDMRIFKMYKFRTMVDTPIDFGDSVCPQYDPRVTFFGRFLRRIKMNELPQFFNILKGPFTRNTRHLNDEEKNVGRNLYGRLLCESGVKPILV